MRFRLTPKTINEWMGRLAEKDAEIERLRAAYESSQATVLKYWEQRCDDHKLITELTASGEAYLSVDGSGAVFDALAVYKARARLQEAVKAGLEALEK